MCMTGFDRDKAPVFYKNQSSFVAHMTVKSGIINILPDSQICDVEFDPCGYSMNSVENFVVSTIHVTLEDGFSYATFEIVGYDLKALNLKQLVLRVFTCFEPMEFSVAVHVDFASKTFEELCMYMEF
ncbi:hypothetical protein QN277_020896 [Acacia crassicarpa]|uniref:Uncharacterized protein n=1 Tax=Acacia crassicarpa TaxID=499986 RepID=A0AAE1JQK4_9FABA|nr:hypothetical protein QN277_020896 [Acacia crassicarpa]